MAQIRQALITGLFVAATAACSGGGGSSGGSSLPTDPTGGGSNNGNNGNNGVNRTLSVTVTNNTFTPGATTITHGSTVQWTWNTCTGDGYSTESCVEHTVTFDDGPTSQLQDRGTFSRTFNTAGTFKYHCTVHGAAMSGEVKVE